MLRKFRLEHCDFPTMVGNVTFLLRTLSLNVDPRNHKRIPIIYTVASIICAASYFYVYVISMVWFVFWRSMETGEVLSALIIFSLGTASLIGPYKLIFMFYNRTKLTQLVGECLDSWTLSEQSSRFTMNLIKTLKIVKRRAIVFWCLVMGNGFLYVTEPIVTPGRHLMEDLFILLGLEPIFESPNYEIAFTLTALSVFFTVYTISNATSFQIITIGYIEAQMLALSEDLINIWKDAEIQYTIHKTMTNDDINEIDKEKNINEYMNKKLKAIIATHATNLNFLRKMEESFKGAILVEFGLLVAGLIAELLAGLENTYMEVPFAMTQVGMDCFIGQRMIDASIVFERAVYDCGWENFDKNNMMLVMMMLMTSQRPMALSAGGMTKLNFVSLLAILKMVYSAYTTLSATLK